LGKILPNLVTLFGDHGFGIIFSEKNGEFDFLTKLCATTINVENSDHHITFQDNFKIVEEIGENRQK
jgi:hypothetical protein